MDNLLDKLRLKKLGAILLAVGAVLAVGSAYQETTTGRWAPDRTFATGTVVERFTSRSHDSSEPATKLRVRMQPTTGEPTTFAQQVTEHFWTRHPVSSTVEVSFRPGSSPQIRGATAGENDVLYRGIAGVAMMVLGVVALLVERFRS